MNAVVPPVVPAIDPGDPSVFGHLICETLRFGEVDANGHTNDVACLARRRW